MVTTKACAPNKWGQKRHVPPQKVGGQRPILAHCIEVWGAFAPPALQLVPPLTNTITVSEIERYIGRKSSFFHTPLHSTPPLGGFPSEHRHPVWCGKTRMVWLQDGEKISKISLFVLAQLTNVTDGRTDRHRVTAIAALCIASHGKND